MEWFRAEDGSFHRTARDRVNADRPKLDDQVADSDAPDPESLSLARTAVAAHHDDLVGNSIAEGTAVPNLFAPTKRFTAADEKPDRRIVKSLTTTFTCIESLADARKVIGDLRDLVSDDAKSAAVTNGRPYVAKALLNPADWRSEYAATVYCRVRSLAPLLDLFGSDLTEAERQEAVNLLSYAWQRVKAEAGSDGIFELGIKNEATDDDVELRYPPNAYLTYWGLAALQSARDVGLAVSHLDAHRRVAAIWLEKCLGTQVALHTISSRRCDPQQIAWAICGLLKAEPTLLAERPTPARELVQAGLRVFFERQDPTGSWPRGEPLFHYPAAGNAYCYPFETLAELVHLSLGTDPLSIELRQMLMPYQAPLVRAFDLALAERRRLPTDDFRFGWCSEHHPHRRSPESWATAAVYRYFQALRRLIGIWVREHVVLTLRAREPAENVEALRDFGETWDAGHGGAGEQLSSLFVHPINSTRVPTAPDDPDAPPMNENFACSAIMFGPPGTGKTTLVEAVAGAIGWKFIEITPAHFLDQGVDRVSARADEVFNMLMELDRHVVLFDEIDELIRQRDDQSESLERFFTTTMLPRLSKLWKAKRLLFFVNTNSIEHVDPAIRRSQRFDTALFVLPPSGIKKLRELGLSGDDPLNVQWCYEFLGDKENLNYPVAHAWLAFVRYDQLKSMRLGLEHHGALELVRVAGTAAYRSDWHEEPTPASARLTASLSDEQMRANAIAKYRKLAEFQRRDSSRCRFVVPEGVTEVPLDVLEVNEGRYWQVLSPEDSLTAWASTHGLEITPDARVTPIT